MSELKQCPFCGGTKICTEKGINLNYCDNCSAESNVEHWNIRPIEDALNARIAELKGVIEILEDQQREAKNILIDKNLHIDSLYEEGYKLQQRIAELEAAQARWVMVSERLPEVDQDVLVFDQRGDITIDYLVALNREGVAYYTNSDDGAVCWMALPQPPEVQE